MKLFFLQSELCLSLALLSLVPSSHVFACVLQHIMNFLEKQNSLLTDTADKLFHMTRENLVQARLPHFHIPAAVQTLTTGERVHKDHSSEIVINKGVMLDY